VSGEPWVVAERIFNMAPSAAAAFSASENGVLAYRNGPPALPLRWFDRTGRETASVAAPAPYLGLFRVSRDGKFLAAPIYDVERGGMDIWLQDLSGDQSKRKLSQGFATRSSPVWSPGGDRVAYLRAEGGVPQLYWSRADSAASEEALPGGFFQVPTDWSRDGRLIAFQTGGGAGEPESDISVVDLTHDRRIFPLMHTPAREIGAAFCPDTSCMAFLSDETGRMELYLQDLYTGPEPRLTGNRRQLSADGALAVRWRADGKELFYLNAENWLVAIPLTHAHAPGAPRRLFQTTTPMRNLSVGGPDWGFDVSPDGQRFLIADGRGIHPAPIIVVENWNLTRH
jgi:Tol biopolymer transport system component